MDPTKKRKLDENGVAAGGGAELTPGDVRKIMERFTPEQLLDILQTAAVRHADVLDAVRSIADSDPTQRKLFIRGLGWETSSENLRALFSAYGELEEAVVINDKNTGKSKGYGFVIYKHVDGALLALKEPSKKIDGRVTVTQLAAAGNSAAAANNVGSSAAGDVAMRKIYVANVPYDMPADKLLAQFAVYGDIEEGPLGFDKQTGKSKGFALFVYKTAEGAQAALVEPVKTIDGRQLNCKLAIDGKKGKPGGPGQPAVDGGRGQLQAGNVHGDGIMQQVPYVVPGGMGPYSGFPGAPQGPPSMVGHHPLNSSFAAGPGLTSQGPGSLTGGAGYANNAAGAGAGAGFYNPYSGYGGHVSAGFSGLSSGTVAGSGALTGGSAGLVSAAPAPGGNVAGGSSLYRLPPSSVGMPSSGYPEAGHYSLSSSSASFPGQNQGTSPAPRAPAGMYPSMPPYY